MNDDEKLAGYQDTATGSRDAATVSDGAAQVSPVSVPEMKSLLGHCQTNQFFGSLRIVVA